MRTILLLNILILFLGCNSEKGDLQNDSIKWDFYKVNLDSEFICSDKSISFLKCDLSISKVQTEDSLNCFYGEFTLGDDFSSTYSKTGDEVHIHTICYDKNNKMKRIEMGSAYSLINECHKRTNCTSTST